MQQTIPYSPINWTETTLYIDWNIRFTNKPKNLHIYRNFWRSVWKQKSRVLLDECHDFQTDFFLNMNTQDDLQPKYPVGMHERTSPIDRFQLVSSRQKVRFRLSKQSYEWVWGHTETTEEEF